MDFEIFFSSLNEKTQKEILEAVGVKDPEEMNWSKDPNMDYCPIAIYPVPERQ